jgi:hypothetical protein
MLDEMEMGEDEAPAGPAGKMVQREKPEVDPARAELVKRVIKEVTADKKHHEKSFKRMREDMEFARLGADKSWADAGKYTANIVQRHIQQRVAALYAKNPRALSRRKQRLDYALWDGSQESLTMAMQASQMAQQAAQQGMVDPMGDGGAGLMQAQALIQDIQQGTQQRKQIDKIGKTLEILFHYNLDEQEPKFKPQAKQLVRRVVTTGVGYVKLGFQRMLAKRADTISQIADVTQRLATIERLSADIADGETQHDSADAEQLRLTLAQLQAEPEVIVREGLVFDFPKSTAVIIDRGCHQLRGFIGADRITHEIKMTPERVQEVFGIDLGKNFTSYTDGGKKAVTESERDGALACVWEVQQKSTGLVYTVCDGYPDFLCEPEPPVVRLERFFTLFALTFNDLEDEEEIFPPSDVRLVRDAQDEYNRAREGLREHRKAARPKYGTTAPIEPEDRDQLQNGVPFQILEFKGLQPGTDLKTVFQMLPAAPIDPNHYEVNPVFEDTQRVLGSGEAQFGGGGGGSATEASISESSRVSSLASNVDDLDDLLTELARCSGQILLMEVSEETAKKIAGPGAVWPSMSGAEIAEEMYLEIKAGSSGRPNKAQELANYERAMPALMQTPGINPQWLAGKYVGLLDETIDLSEAWVANLPSIVAQNAMASRPPPAPAAPAKEGKPGAPQPSTGDPTNDPAQQGAQGGMNAPNPQENEPGAQPAFPTQGVV